MKIVNRKEFLKMPPKTIFSFYQDYVWHEAYIKGKSYENDFLRAELFAIQADGIDDQIDKLDGAKKGEKANLSCEEWSRDGMFEETQMFLIFEKKDIETLIKTLKNSLKNYE